MKRTSIHAATAAIVAVMLLSCQANHHEEYSDALANADSSYLSSAEVDTTFSQVKSLFIRKASLKCKVKDVHQMDRFIVDETKKRGGYVELSDKRSNTLSSEIVETTEDSVKEVKRILTTAVYTLRIPDELVDQYLSDLEAKATFIDFKRTSAKDVGVDLLHNKLKVANRVRADRNNQTNLNTRKGNVENYMNASNLNLLNADEVTNFQVQDATIYSSVNYSELEVECYQNEEVAIQVNPNVSPEKFHPGYFYEAKNAFLFGWTILRSLSLFLLNLWPIFVLGVGIVFIAKMRKIKLV